MSPAPVPFSLPMTPELKKHIRSSLFRATSMTFQESSPQMTWMLPEGSISKCTCLRTSRMLSMKSPSGTTGKPTECQSRKSLPMLPSSEHTWLFTALTPNTIQVTQGMRQFPIQFIWATALRISMTTTWSATLHIRSMFPFQAWTISLSRPSRKTTPRNSPARRVS